MKISCQSKAADQHGCVHVSHGSLWSLRGRCVLINLWSKPDVTLVVMKPSGMKMRRRMKEGLKQRK